MTGNGNRQRKQATGLAAKIALAGDMATHARPALEISTKFGRKKIPGNRGFFYFV
jgi:hypothetical protein